VPAGADNLAARAARAFLERAGRSARVAIALTKHTPVAAGLGGGSSDAAAVLRGLADALPGALDPAALAEVALGLGADVTFFLAPRPAFVRGIGERIEPVRGLPPLALLLANPGQPLPSGDVYRVWDALGRPVSPRSDRAPDLATALACPDALAALLHNDLEDAAARLCPAIPRLRRRLEAAGARAVGLSGSGATLFGVFADRAAAEAAAGRLDGAGAAWARVATTLESG
jgi:4-diphosphocytidyl-2-C-methyl-D-erythritol kinase